MKRKPPEHSCGQWFLNNEKGQLFCGDCDKRFVELEAENKRLRALLHSLRAYLYDKGDIAWRQIDDALAGRGKP